MLHVYVVYIESHFPLLYLLKDMRSLQLKKNLFYFNVVFLKLFLTSHFLQEHLLISYSSLIFPIMEDYKGIELGRWRQEEQCFKASLDYMRP